MTLYSLFFLVAAFLFIVSIFAGDGRWPLWFFAAAIWIVTFIFWAQTW